MSEWWTYRPSDFLMFSPRIYARLFEGVNEAWWPLQVPLLAAGLWGLLALAGRRDPGRARPALGLGLGLAWLFCSVVFLRERYQPIQWAVAYLIPALLVLAALLPWLAWRSRAAAAPAGVARQVALALGAWALLLHPLLAWPAWRQAEVWALAPDPTAIATLALLLSLPRDPSRAGRALQVLAWLLTLAWCAFGTLMLAAMGSPKAWVLGLACGLAVAARVVRAPAGRGAGQPGG